jgi:hypothetical protein
MIKLHFNFKFKIIQIFFIWKKSKKKPDKSSIMKVKVYGIMHYHQVWFNWKYCKNWDVFQNFIIGIIKIIFSYWLNKIGWTQEEVAILKKAL